MNINCYFSNNNNTMQSILFIFADIKWKRGFVSHILTGSAPVKPVGFAIGINAYTK